MTKRAFTSVVDRVPSSSIMNRPARGRRQDKRASGERCCFCCRRQQPGVRVFQRQQVVLRWRTCLPVMSPSSLDAWKMEGFSKVNIAWPDVPVRERRRDTSGTVDSFTPLMNCSEAASQTCRCCLGACRRGAASAPPWKGRTPVQDADSSRQQLSVAPNAIELGIRGPEGSASRTGAQAS